jgi:hypothetical protein
VLGNSFVRDLMKLAKKIANQPIVGTFCNDLDAIARRKDDRFGDILPANKRGQSLAQRVAVESESLPDFNRRSFMADSDD